MDDATIESGLVHDFDASLSGIGQELGAGAYSMRLELRESTCQQWLANQNHANCCPGVISVDVPSVPLGVGDFPPTLCAESNGFSLFWDLGQDIF